MALRSLILLNIFQFAPLREGRPEYRTGDGTSGLFQFAPLREGRRRSSSVSSATFNFNSRPCGRGDGGIGNQFNIHGSYFNSRPCGRGDGGSTPPSCDPNYFNSRPCGRGDARLAGLFAPTIFQFTPLREGRHAGVTVGNKEGLFQFTPLREGRLPLITDVYKHISISIHAPAGGATSLACILFGLFVISIHAPAGGATAARAGS